MNEPQVFKPRVLNSKRAPNVTPIVCESRLVSDLTMPEQDWSRYDAPPLKRGFVSKREVDLVPVKLMFLTRQAS